MTSTPSFVVRQCPEPECRFRFPAPEGTIHIPCPKCAEPTVVVEFPLHEPEGKLRSQSGIYPEVKSLLDNIRSSYNVGSMFRTADGVGISHLYLAGTTPTPGHTGVKKTALGAENAVTWSFHHNAVDLAQELNSSGHHLWGLEVGSQSTSLFRTIPDLTAGPIVLVVGNEVAGVDRGLQALCEVMVGIPMQGFKESLNVATAFGIAAYFLRFGHQIKSGD